MKIKNMFPMFCLALTIALSAHARPDGFNYYQGATGTDASGEPTLKKQYTQLLRSISKGAPGEHQRFIAFNLQHKRQVAAARKGYSQGFISGAPYGGIAGGILGAVGKFLHTVYTNNDTNNAYTGVTRLTGQDARNIALWSIAAAICGTAGFGLLNADIEMRRSIAQEVHNVDNPYTISNWQQYTNAMFAHAHNNLRQAAQLHGSQGIPFTLHTLSEDGQWISSENCICTYGTASDQLRLDEHTVSLATADITQGFQEANKLAQENPYATLFGFKRLWAFQMTAGAVAGGFVGLTHPRLLNVKGEDNVVFNERLAMALVGAVGGAIAGPCIFPVAKIVSSLIHFAVEHPELTLCLLEKGSRAYDRHKAATANPIYQNSRPENENKSD